MSNMQIEKKIDELLDKINRRGFESLSAEERAFLDRISRLYKHRFPS